MVGDVFMTTFDGRMFLQPGACQYVLAKSRSTSRFTVTLQYTTCTEVDYLHTLNQTLQYCFYRDLTVCMVCVSTAADVYSVSDSGVG